ncbi:MAG TPA: Gfo/Idh/MocA family oxidoreductase, partial [Microthrixaceae bacterium]|nr:Gfo/Idh/MocA family oxidoreductase [Microthrixaceae bacterium]
CFPLASRNDIRWQLDLAGGALMDAGCYPVHMLRHLVGPFAGGEPTVTEATARVRFPGVDRLTEAELRFPNGVTASLRASMWSRHLLSLRVRIHGSQGRLVAINPLAPHYYSSLRVRASAPGAPSFKERPPRSSTYLHQLDAFCDAVQHGTHFPTTTADSIANMAVIDSIYRAAGLGPRRPTGDAT